MNSEQKLGQKEKQVKIQADKLAYQRMQKLREKQPIKFSIISRPGSQDFPQYAEWQQSVAILKEVIELILDLLNNPDYDLSTMDKKYILQGAPERFEY